jgi:5,10-methenyltetrahydromethanopterin hydrogenase
MASRQLMLAFAAVLVAALVATADASRDLLGAPIGWACVISQPP